ncbi:hypothetical protein RSOLAG1IB_09799 [Rhizoctonia solani AG-1 IB]|uniref:Uncharacterized protein n=1 Tax=Thanatephorus cucumeris (strain AG1-IB / isolate 7/3/14) TaxID=1108050 RepID=A0A0B7FYB2_THACB|nr:hypothetical protein RSOLAG1IB_09799 [Rhizoctonia solani AG-1 IB]
MIIPNTNRITFVRLAKIVEAAPFDSALIWKTRVKREILQQGSFITMARPERRGDYGALHEVAVVERFVASQLPDYNAGSWRLVGWKIEMDRRVFKPATHQFMVVLEDLSP